MESYFNTTLDSNKETNNLIYNVINSQEPRQLFIYGLIIVIITFISTKIIYNSNILVGLIFCSLIIYYLHTYRTQNVLSDKEKFREKFDAISTDSNILNKYPKIVDFLFYMENFKYKDIENYNSIINSFELFCKLYEYCIIDYNLISQNYPKLIDEKNIILNKINNLNFIYNSSTYENTLIKQKISAEKIIDELLNNLVILFKKNIYYNGYNNGTTDINYSNVLPYNILYSTNYKKTDDYNIANLIFI
jgi:hypothetical protein